MRNEKVSWRKTRGNLACLIFLERRKKKIFPRPRCKKREKSVRSWAVAEEGGICADQITQIKNKQRGWWRKGGYRAAYTRTHTGKRRKKNRKGREKGGREETRRRERERGGKRKRNKRGSEGTGEGRKWRALRRNGAETGDSDGQWAPADSSNRTKTRSRGERDRGRTTTPWLCP